MPKEQICCPGVLEKFVDDLLKNSKNITFEHFKSTLLNKGFELHFIDGDENHGTYSFTWNSPDFSVEITKCHCGCVHYLEDLCSKCDSDWLYEEASNPFRYDFDDNDLPF